MEELPEACWAPDQECNKLHADHNKEIAHTPAGAPQCNWRLVLPLLLQSRSGHCLSCMQHALSIACLYCLCPRLVCGHKAECSAARACNPVRLSHHPVQELLLIPVCQQVQKLQKQAAEQVDNVKTQLKTYLKKHPLAAKYAKEPYLTWVLYGITAITVTSTWALGAVVLGTPVHPVSCESI